MSIPIGRDAGLPIGGQLIAPRFAEGPMLAAAGAMERLIAAEAEVRA